MLNSGVAKSRVDLLTMGVKHGGMGHKSQEVGVEDSNANCPPDFRKKATQNSSKHDTLSEKFTGGPHSVPTSKPSGFTSVSPRVPVRFMSVLSTTGPDCNPEHHYCHLCIQEICHYHKPTTGSACTPNVTKF